MSGYAGGGGSAREPWLHDPRDASRPSVTGEYSKEVAPQSKQLEYKNKQQLVRELQDNRSCAVDVNIRDVVDMVADLRGVSRSAMLHTAVVAWFYHALGFPVLEVDCHEQPRTEDSASGLLLFRVRLDANHATEVARLGEGDSLTAKFRRELVAALPGAGAPTGNGGGGGAGGGCSGGESKGIGDGGDNGSTLSSPASASNACLEEMLHITWTKGGSIELGGVAALSLIVLIIMAMGIGLRRWDSGSGPCPGMCPCISRPGRSEGEEYAAAIRELRARGTEIEVSPDGSAKLRVPPLQDARRNLESKWSCPECSIL